MLLNNGVFEMKNLKKSDKFLLIFLGALVIIFIYSKYFLMPVLDNINKSKTEIDKYNSQINLLKVLNISNDKLKEERAKVRLTYNTDLTELPSLEKNPEIAYNIKPLADSNNISLESVSLSDGILYTTPTNENRKNIVPIDSTNLYTAGVNISVTGANYSDMMDFVNSLENDKRINEITSFSIQYQKSPEVVTNTQSINTDGTTTNTDGTTTNIDGTTTTNDSSNSISTTQTTTNTDIVNANISINYFYNSNSSSNLKPKYDFNKGNYGKDDLFK